MKRFSILLFGVLWLGSSAVGQQDMRSRLRSKGPVKNAGIFHYGTGKWTRPGSMASQAQLGPPWRTIYNNSCSTAYVGTFLSDEYVTDEGRLPSRTSPDKIFDEAQASSGLGTAGDCPRGPSSAPGSAAGSASAYTIGAFNIEYCSNSIGATTTIVLEFRESANATPLGCAESRATAPAPVASFALTNFPGGAGGPFGCWNVFIDLTAAQASFSMRADATGDYTIPPGSSDLEHLFSWTFRFPNALPPTASGASGWAIAGNPANRTGGPNLPLGAPNSNGWKVGLTTGGSGSARAGYDGTVWDKHGANALPNMFNGGSNGSQFPPGSLTPEAGTGMSTKDCFRVDKGATTSQKHYGGPASPATNPFSSFYLRLFTKDDTSFVSPPGTGFCYGDGCAFTCPCSLAPIPNPQGGHESGCSNGPSLGFGSTLTTSGSANPFATESVRLTCRIDHVAPFQSPLAIGVKGDGRLVNGVFPAANDGVRCVDGPLIHFGAHLAGTNGNAPGTWSYPTTVGSETIPVSLATGATNSRTSWFQVLHRNAPRSFCFSDELVGTNWSNGMIVKWGAP